MAFHDKPSNRQALAANCRAFIGHLTSIPVFAIVVFLSCAIGRVAAEEAVDSERSPVSDESVNVDVYPAVEHLRLPLSPAYENAKRVYTQLTWATYLHTIRRLSDAKEMYVHLLENHEPSAFIHTKLAILSHEMQDIKGAERECRRAIELQPDKAAPHFLLGEILVLRLQRSRRSAPRWDEMIAEFQKVTELQPDHVEAHRYLAGLGKVTENYELAIHSFKELTRIMPYHARFHFDLAELYEGLERREEAIAAYERAVKIDRNLSDGHEKLGLLYVEHFDQIISQSDASREELESAKESLESAINTYGELRRLGKNPVDYDTPLARLRTRLGSICLELGEEERGIEILGEVHLEYPDDADVNYWLGIAHQQQGDLERAYPYLKKAATLAPGDVVRRYFAIEQYKEAINILQDVLRNDPENVEAIYWTGLAYEGLGNFQETESYLRKAISLAPEYADALNALGYFFAEHGTNLDEAVDLIKKALKNSPEEAGYIDSLGWAYFKQGKLDKALRQLEMAIRLMPESAEIQDHLGDAYMKKGLKDKAIAAWQRAIQLEPNNTAIREKLRTEIGD